VYRYNEAAENARAAAESAHAELARLADLSEAGLVTIYP
jgi:hypothetical protein